MDSKIIENSEKLEIKSGTWCKIRNEVYFIQGITEVGNCYGLRLVSGMLLSFKDVAKTNFKRLVEGTKIEITI